MPTSKLQNLVRELIDRVIPPAVKYYENYRPDWLATGYGGRLELDFFIPSFSLAVEIQGAQHASFVEWFHGDETGFAEQLERDKKKRLTCESRGVSLLEIWSQNDIGPLQGLLNSYISPAIPSEWTNLRRLQNPNINTARPVVLTDLLLYMNQLKEALSENIDKDITRLYVIIKRLGIKNITVVLRGANESQSREFASIMQIVALYFAERKRPNRSEGLVVSCGLPPQYALRQTSQTL